MFNKDLENILKVFYGINRSRILTKDSVLLKTAYDLTLKADKEITTRANCVEMLKYLLPEQTGIELTEIYKDTLAGVIQVENDSLLNSRKSKSQYHVTSVRYDNWESKGASIEDLRDFLEDNYSILIETDKPDNRKFDFIIPSKDLKEVKEILKKKYGLIIKMKNQKIKFWEIENRV